MTSASKDSRRLLIALAGLAVVGVIGGAWFLRDSAPPPDEAGSTSPPAGESSPAQDPALPPGEVLRQEDPDAPEPPALSFTPGHSLRGRVRTPEGDGVGAATVQLHLRTPPLTEVSLRSQIDQAQRLPWGGSEQDLQKLGPRAQTPRPEGAAATARCDPEGWFTLPAPDSGTVWFVVEAPGLHLDHPRSLTLEPDQDPGELELVVLRAAAIEARVLSPDGAPVAGAEVLLLTPMGMLDVLEESATFREPANASTDADGLARFEAVPASGRYLVLARAEPWCRAQSEEFRVSDGEVHRETLRLQAGAELLVRLHDPAGRPIEGATVEVADLRIQLGELQTQGAAFTGSQQTTDEQGRARFTGMSPGPRTVFARSRHHAPERRKLELQLGEQELRLELRPGQVLAGRVVDAEGGPLVGARVKASPPVSITDMRSFAAAEMEPATDVDEQGTFRLEHLAEGKATLAVDAPGYETLREDVVAPSTDLLLQPRPMAGIEGVVVSRLTGDAVLRFEVELRRAEGIGLDFSRMAERMTPQRVRVRSEDGRFRILGIPAGRIRVEVEAPDHAVKDLGEIKLAPGELRRGLVCYLDPEAILGGRVVADRDGTAVPGATLRWTDRVRNPIEKAMEQWLPGSSTHADEAGRFEIRGLSGGQYWLEASASGFADSTAGPFELRPGQRRDDTEVRLLRGGVVYGTVSGADGAPRVGTRVLSAPTGGSRVLSTTTDERGDYRIEGMTAGTWSVTLLPDSMDMSSDFLASVTRDVRTEVVQIEDETELRVDFAARPLGTCRLHGEVLQEGEGLEGAMVAVLPRAEGTPVDGSGAQIATTDADGAFVLEGLMPGPVAVQVQPELSVLGAAPLQRLMTLREGEDRALRFEVPGGSITGRVVDARGGEGVSGVGVQASLEDAGPLGDPLARMVRARAAVSRTDDQGRFRLRHLAPGRYVVRAGAPDFLDLGSQTTGMARSDAIEVQSGSIEIGTLRLEPTGSIEGVVQGADGAAVVGATIFLRAEDGSSALFPFGVVITGSAGEYEHPSVPAGRYQVLARARGRALTHGPVVEVGPGSRVSADLLLETGTDVYVLLAGTEDDALPSVSVVATDAAGRRVSGYVGLGDLERPAPAPGEYWIGTFAAGEYLVRGQVDGRAFERKITLSGQPELRIPLSFD